MSDYTEAKKILEKYHQEHLLMFYDDLSATEKSDLIEQIFKIDFKQIFDLYEASKTDEVIDNTKVEPLKIYIKSKVFSNRIKQIGVDAIKRGEYALVTMAGGQGSRLGFGGPKGTYKLEFDDGTKKSLFEIMCDNLKDAELRYGVQIPWYIMTSTENYADTKQFFRSKNFFDYPEEKIKFFVQHDLPVINTDENLILEELHKIKEVANGNGDVFKSMREHKIIDHMRENGIKWCFFSGIDNVILDVIDPFFLGLTISKEKQVAAKSIIKGEASNKEWIFAKYKGEPCLLCPKDFTEVMIEQTDKDGEYCFRDVNILAHLFSVTAIEQMARVDLKYHRAFKKNTFINDEGMKQVPEEPNCFKFENFIFDSFNYFDDVLVLRVNRADEFAPIKDFKSINNPDTAKALYQAKYNK